MADNLPSSNEGEMRARFEKFRGETDLSEEEKQDPAIFRRLNDINAGIADFLGFVLDPMIQGTFAGAPEELERPDSVRKQLSEYGLAPPPGAESDDFLGRMLYDMGNVLVPSLLTFGYGSVLSQTGRAAQLASKTPGAISSVTRTPFENVAKTAAENPVKYWLTEFLSSFGATHGGILGETLTDGSPAGRAIGELLGGLSPEVVRGLTRAGGTVKKFSPFRGHDQRAARRMQQLFGSALDEIHRNQSDNILGLPPAIHSGDPGAASLQRAVEGANPQAAARLARKEAQAMRRAEQILLGSDPEKSRKAVRAYLNNLVSSSLANVKKRLSRLSPRKEYPAAIVKDELNKSYRTARGRETALWRKVKNPAVDTTDVDTLWEKTLRSRLPEDNPADIPEYLRTFLGDLEQKGRALLSRSPHFYIYKPGKMRPRVANVQALRSRIMEDIADEITKPRPNRSKLRIMNKTQDALLQTLSSSSTGPQYDAALEYSRQLNNRFTKGFVGRFLGTSTDEEFATLGPDIYKSLTNLDASDQRKAVQQMLAASPKARRRVEDIVKQTFYAQTVEDEIFLKDRGKKFLRRNKGMLEEFPEVRKQIDELIDEQATLDTFMGERGPVTMSPVKKRMAVTGLYLNAPIGQEVQRILTQTENPAAAFRALIKELGGDKNALRGLRTTVKMYLLDQAKLSTGVNVLGESNISGRRLTKLLEQHAGDLNPVLSPSERRRLKVIARELIKIESARGIGAAEGGVISDAPARVLDIIARMIGAKGGQALSEVGGGRGAGLGSSLVLAQTGSKEATGRLYRWTNDVAKQILIEAVEDQEKWDELVRLGTSKDLEKTLVNALGWLAIPTTTAAGVQQKPEEKDPRKRRFQEFQKRMEAQGVTER